MNKTGVQSFNVHLMCLDVVSHQWNANCWLSGAHARIMKTVSDCLHRKSYASGILQVIFQGASHNKALTARLNDSMPEISGSSKPSPHPCNSALGHPNNICHMPVRKAEPPTSRSYPMLALNKRYYAQAKFENKEYVHEG